MGTSDDTDATICDTSYIRDQNRNTENRVAVCENTPLVSTLPSHQVKMSIFCRRWFRSDRKILVDVLAIWFGIGAWIAINGLFVQLPLLVQTQPEGWNLPSYLSVIVQIANIGPILYTVLHKTWPGKIRDSTIIYGVLMMGTVALLLTAFFYQKTTTVYGEERSTALFSLVFFISLVGCTSSVLFIPYMGNFREIYLISYFVGEGLSGFLPSVVALAQGVGGNPTCVNQTQPDGSTSMVPHTRLPNFSTQAYFFFLFSVSAVSTVCFFLLNYLQTSKNEQVTRQLLTVQKDNQYNTTVQTISSATPDSSIAPDLKMVKGDNQRSSNAEIITVPKPTNVDKTFSTSLNIYLLFIISWVCGLGNGVFPSIQSYSCLPYGNVVYHLSATLGSMANPVACFIAFFLPISSLVNISVLASLSTVMSGYILATALTSPAPPMVNTAIGEAIIVLCWILNTGLISFVKMSIASLYRRQGGQGLFWFGALQQVGSAVGALVTFFLVNYAGIFTQYYPCQ